MSPDIITKVVTIHRRRAAQHPEWSQKQLLDAVCYSCWATHGLELEHEDVLVALDAAAPVAQIRDQIPATGA